MVELKKLLVGRGVEPRVVDCSAMLSPVIPRSPSDETTPTVVRTGPLGGVTKPLTGTVTFGSRLLTRAAPEVTVRLRTGAAGSCTTTMSDQPAPRLHPVPPCTLAMV